MTPYVSFFSVSFALLVLGLSSQKQGLRAVIVLLIVILSVSFSGFRGLVGTDTAAYHTIFNEFDLRYADVGDWTRFEPLFMAFLGGVKLTTNDPFLFTLALSVLQGVLLFLIVRDRRGALIFIFAYLCFFYLRNHFNTLRSGVAALLLVLAYQRLEDDKTNWWILLCACLFHFGSLLVAPFLVRAENFRRALAIMAVGFVGFSALAFDYVEKKLTYYFVDSAFYSSGSVSFGAGFVLTTLIIFYVHFKVNRFSILRLHALFFVLMCLKFLQMLYPVLWRLHEVFFIVWIAATAFGLRGGLFKVHGYAFLVFCLIGFWSTTYLALKFDLENRIEREKRMGEVRDSLFDAPLVPYKTFIQ